MAATSKPKRARVPADDIALDFPPFPGFDRIGFKFLKELKANNNREWFTPERKAVYQDHLVEPMRSLLAELRLRYQQEGLPYAPDPKSSMFRIYRDTRFSKDKTPYKVNIAATIPYGGEGKEGLGNYLHIEPGACFFGGGAYFMDSAGLRRLRTRIADDPDELRAIAKGLKKTFGEIRGEKLKRGPVGFDKDHPAMDLLLYTQMWISTQFPDKLAGSPELVDWVVEKTIEAHPFNQYLHDAIRG